MVLYPLGNALASAAGHRMTPALHRSTCATIFVGTHPVVKTRIIDASTLL